MSSGNIDHIQLSLFGNMGTRSRPPRGLPELPWAPISVCSRAPSMPGDKSYTYIAPSCICRSAAHDLRTVHFLILRCLRRRRSRSSMPRPLNTIELLGTGWAYVSGNALARASRVNVHQGKLGKIMPKIVYIKRDPRLFVRPRFLHQAKVVYKGPNVIE